MLDYQKAQRDFAAHIRNPSAQAAPTDVEDRRIAIYRDLFFNNIENFIANAFPVFKRLFDEQAWQALIRDFLTVYRCHSPYFLEISEEFLRYLEDPKREVHKQYPFAYALCHYEWVELAIDISDEQCAYTDIDDTDVLHYPLAVSSLAWSLRYGWPVQLIGADFQPQLALDEPVCLIAYRGLAGDVEFLQANTVTLRLLELLKSEVRPSGLEALQTLALELSQADDAAIVEFGTALLRQFKALGIVLGRHRA